MIKWLTKILKWVKIINAFVKGCRVMVDVAQLVRALVCGTRGRGFESHLPPHKNILGCSQAVRHVTLTHACASSNLASPANKSFRRTF